MYLTQSSEICCTVSMSRGLEAKFQDFEVFKPIMAHNVDEKKLDLAEWNQDFRGWPIYHEWRNYHKTYFSGSRMMLVT